MKKNIFLLLLAVLIVFTLASCKLNDDSYVSIPKDYLGRWVVFNGEVTDKYFEITRSSILAWKGSDFYPKDLSFNFPGVKEKRFDAETYTPVQSFNRYFSDNSVGYEQTWNDTTLWLIYNAQSDTIRLIEVYGVDNVIKYNYNLIRR